MNTQRHAKALICVIAISSAFAASASAEKLNRTAPARVAAAKTSNSSPTPSPTPSPTIGEAKGEFRKMLRSSPALRWDHAKRIVRNTLRADQGVAALTAGLAMPAALAISTGPVGWIAGGVVGGGFLTAAVHDGDVLRQTRRSTAQSMIKRGMISPGTFERWSQAGLF